MIRYNMLILLLDWCKTQCTCEGQQSISNNAVTSESVIEMEYWTLYKSLMYLKHLN